MPIDPYAALHAMLRAEAVRNSPAPSGPAAPSHTDEEDTNTPEPAPTPTPTHHENQHPHPGTTGTS
jgi:hypothetical protein